MPWVPCEHCILDPNGQFLKNGSFDQGTMLGELFLRKQVRVTFDNCLLCTARQVSLTDYNLIGAHETVIQDAFGHATCVCQLDAHIAVVVCQRLAIETDVNKIGRASCRERV